MSNYFSGELRGYTVRDLRSKIDYSVDELDERMSVSEEIVDTGFFEEYFDNHYNVHCTKDMPLSEQNNVCRMIESLGTYILNSDEEIEQRKSSSSTHHNMGVLINKMNRESSLESIATDSEMSNTIIHNIKASDVSKIAQNKTIHIKPLTKSNVRSVIDRVGLKDKDTIKIIESYASYHEALDKSKAPKQQVDRVKMGLRKDIETLIEESFPPVKHNNLEFNNSNAYEVELGDLTKQHSLLGVTFYNRSGSLEYQPGLLFYNKGEGLNVEDEIELLLYDLDNIIKESGLTEREKKVLTYLRRGVKMGVIAEKVGVSARTVTKDKQKVISKVLETSIKINKGG